MKNKRGSLSQYCLQAQELLIINVKQRPKTQGQRDLGAKSHCGDQVGTHVCFVLNIQYNALPSFLLGQL